MFAVDLCFVGLSNPTCLNQSLINIYHYEQFKKQRATYGLLGKSA